MRTVSTEAKLGKSSLWMLVIVVCSGCWSADKTPASEPASPVAPKRQVATSQPAIKEGPAPVNTSAAQPVPSVAPKNAQRQEEKRLYAEVKKIPATAFWKNRQMYSRLMELNPQNPLYKKKYKYYDRKILEQKENLAEKRSQYAQEFAQRFRSQGIEMSVFAEGENRSTLKFVSPLMNKSIMDQLADDEGSSLVFRNLKFRKLVFSDGEKVLGSKDLNLDQ